MTPHLTAIILTHNEARHITDCIESVRFADHVLVFDSFSEDDTRSLAADAGAEVVTHTFENYASQRNAALDHVAGLTDWVLFIDADERVSSRLAIEVRQELEDVYEQMVAYRVPRHNYIFGKLTRGAGWYPDYQTRLLRVGRTHYDPKKLVHEVVVLEGDLGTLENALTHYNYRDMQQFGEKQRRYSRYDAEILYQLREPVKPWTLLTMPLRHFWWRFVTLRGWQNGWHGLLLSMLMARYEFRKYRLLGEFWRQGATAT